MVARQSPRDSVSWPDGSHLTAGLIGSGIGASLSPPLHESEAAALGLHLTYHRLDLDELGRTPTEVGELVAMARREHWVGLNITYPCKQLVMPHLDALSPAAAAIGAVNTVVFREGEAIGHNTDCAGFARGLELGLPNADLSAITLLGAGGAGAAVAYALLDRGVPLLTIVDVDVRRANSLVDVMVKLFPDREISARPAHKISECLPASTGLVNATPIGMDGHPGMPVPADLVHSGLWVADIVYHPMETALLRTARERDCPTQHGGFMLVAQAADGLSLFTGRAPEQTRMLTHFEWLVAQKNTDLTASG